MMMTPPDEHKYDWMWKSVKNRYYWSFTVKACGDVHVILTNRFGVIDTDIIEYSIGGWENQRCVIR